MTIIRLVRVLLAALVLLGTGVAAAQGEPKKDEGWEDVQGGMMMQPGEGFEAKNLVAGAYAFIWVMVAGFAIAVWRRTDSVEKELGDLKKRIDAAPRK